MSLATGADPTALPPPTDRAPVAPTHPLDARAGRAATAAADAADAADAAPTLDLVVPVYNEAHVLEESIDRLRTHLRTAMPYPWRLTIVDNGSTDGTAELARRLGERWPEVRVLQLDRKGRGLALRTAWSTSDAAVLAYTDVDLSTGLDALLPLIAPLVTGHSDVAIGSRLLPASSVARGPRREVISRLYNLLLRTLFATRFHDAQCGFKAVRSDAAAVLLPEVDDDEWFFDTELLLLAEHNGLRVHEVPVDWVDDPDSRVDVVHTALDDLRGVARMAWRFGAGRGHIDPERFRPAAPADDMGRQGVTFLAIGTVSTAISLATFLALRAPLGAVAANAIALSVTAAANTWANRHFTFGRRGGAQRRRDYGRGTAVFLGGLALSTAALVGVAAAGGGAAAETVAVVTSWALTTVVRFSLLRGAMTPQTVGPRVAPDHTPDAASGTAPDPSPRVAPGGAEDPAHAGSAHAGSIHVPNAEPGGQAHP